VKPNFRVLGPRVGKRMPKLKAALAEADGAALLRQLEAEGRVRIAVEGETVELSREEIAVSLEARAGFAAASGPVGVVVLRTALSPVLVEEGRYREVLNRVQSLRKELDLEYTGRIRLSLAGSSALLDAVRPRAAELARETLADDVAGAAGRRARPRGRGRRRGADDRLARPDGRRVSESKARERIRHPRLHRLRLHRERAEFSCERRVARAHLGCPRGGARRVVRERGLRRRSARSARAHWASARSAQTAARASRRARCGRAPGSPTA
jgi:hypothetical protein